MSSTHPAFDRRTLGVLLALRYRLLWASARTRTGKVALGLVGYLLVLLAGGLLLAGGYGGAVAAIESGRAEFVLRIVLGSVFATAVLASVILGVGISPALSDAALRRFPLSGRERFFFRHLTALLEPVWLLVAAVDIGVAAGSAAKGVGAFLTALPAALLLVVVNYLVAQVVVTFVDRVMRTRAGRAALTLAVLLGILLGPAAIRAAAGASTMLSTVSLVARGTPPFATAAAVSTGGVRALAWLAAVAAWAVGLAAGLLWLERWHPSARAAAASPLAWDEIHDQAASLFGPSMAPLFGKTLRYLTRSPQVRIPTLMALPSFVLLTATAGFARDGPGLQFPMALAAIAMVAGSSTGGLLLNLFGFDGAGFRRYLLLPVSPARVLFASSTSVLVPGACLLPLAALFWAVYAPAPTDPRSLVMLVSSGVAGLFIYPMCGVWTSVLAPTAIEFDRTWGNKLSLPANAVMVGMIGMFFGLIVAYGKLGIREDALVAHWWVAVLAAAVAAALWVLTVFAAGRVLVARRERMLVAIDAR